MKTVVNLNIYVSHVWHNRGCLCFLGNVLSWSSVSEHLCSNSQTLGCKELNVEINDLRNKWPSSGRPTSLGSISSFPSVAAAVISSLRSWRLREPGRRAILVRGLCTAAHLAFLSRVSLQKNFVKADKLKISLSSSKSSVSISPCLSSVSWLCLYSAGGGWKPDFLHIYVLCGQTCGRRVK